MTSEIIQKFQKDHIRRFLRKVEKDGFNFDSERSKKISSECLVLKKTYVMGLERYISSERWSKSLIRNLIVKSCNCFETWVDLITSHYATLLSPYEAGKPKASLTLKRCRCGLETIHVFITLGHYH